MTFKNKYALFASIYWEFYFKTIIALCRKNIFLIPLLPFVYLFKAIKYISNFIFHSLCKKICENKIKRINQTKQVKDYIKPIALYLPQYHSIPENNKWWGEGFTEWVNVKKAKPCFSYSNGSTHYQPHVPCDELSYYDLTNVDIMRQQAKLAQKFDVYGFCFYYYYFKNGKRLLEKPINNYLQAKDIKFPFCFCWANENWTRVWDGGNKDILIDQDYSEENICRMIKEMLPAFKDERYIKVDGRPLLFVYRAEIITYVKKITYIWQNIAKSNGFEKGLYLVSMQNFQEINPSKMGFDASSEFAVAYRKINPWLNCKQLIGNKEIDRLSSYPIIMSDMDSIMRKMLFRPKTRYNRIKCVCPGWDNTPRRGMVNSALIYDSSPERFYRFYKGAVIETIARNENGIVMINAWNEWGEGAHLEPDKKNGYQFLEQIYNIQNLQIKDLITD